MHGKKKKTIVPNIISVTSVYAYQNTIKFLLYVVLLTRGVEKEDSQ